MSDIMMALAGLSHGLNATTVRRLAVIVDAMLPIQREPYHCLNPTVPG
nr:hypothetical protein [Gammaproteobacteria bacterium]